jgi:hypothetical protein
MQDFIDFISEHRERFEVEHNNIVSLSFSKVTRHWQFLEIIYQRYIDASEALIANSDAMQAIRQPGPGPHTMTAEQISLMNRGHVLSVAAHLEIESFYLFAKILLDEIAHSFECYFGSARGVSLDSHDNLTKYLAAYAAVKELTILPSFAERTVELKKRISDYRDYQIAHEKSPRTLRGTMWGPDRRLRMSNNRVYPKASDRQVDTESLEELKNSLEDYIRDLIVLIESNADKTALRLQGN